MPDAPTPLPYKAFRRFNRTPLLMNPHSRARGVRDMEQWFGGKTMEERLARPLLEARAVPFKELLESFEFHARTRKVLRGPVVVDLCAGHGLTGVLFAAFDRSVEVWLVDTRRPQSTDTVLSCVESVVPGVSDRVRYLEQDLTSISLPRGASVLGVHACGAMTDAVIGAALRSGGPVGVMPCCHSRATAAAPDSLVRGLGLDTATDVGRTYRLEAAGYRTRWTGIPSLITPKNRIILGWLPPPQVT
jgi:hypothetical protein